MSTVLVVLACIMLNAALAALEVAIHLRVESRHQGARRAR
jgi:hypothetical protein